MRVTTSRFGTDLRYVYARDARNEADVPADLAQQRIRRMTAAALEKTNVAVNR